MNYYDSTHIELVDMPRGITAENQVSLHSQNVALVE
jgi:hypothetical protein